MKSQDTNIGEMPIVALTGNIITLYMYWGENPQIYDFGFHFKKL